MIRAGVLILLFVTYQLWGTGIHTTQAQHDLGREFRSTQEQLAADTGSTDPTTTSTTSPSEGGTGSTVAPPVPGAAGGLPIPEPGQPIGQITIPRIGADFYMVEGTDLKWLKEGPGHFAGTPYPGQAGNAAVAGHRTTYKAPFNRIDELEPGDKITIVTLQGTFTYEVLPQEPSDPGGPALGHRIVGPTAIEILDDKGDNRLTLMACNPKYSASQRIVVEARLIGNPAPDTPKSAPTTPEAVADVGLAGGDQSARLPAIAWSLLALFIWFGAWYLAHRRLRGWWRVAPYVVAIPFFTVALYATFENITRLLPGAY
jgi:sortase A